MSILNLFGFIFKITARPYLFEAFHIPCASVESLQSCSNKSVRLFISLGHVTMFVFQYQVVNLMPNP